MENVNCILLICIRKAALLSLFSFLFSFTSIRAQNFTIKGSLIDKETKRPLEAATVYLETTKDSTLVTYTITNQKGDFTLEGRSQIKDLRINISFLGYEGYTQKIKIDRENISLGNIEVAPSTNRLDEILIKSRAPITVKKDTLEFNVSSFKTKKDANIEDLLKELPGVDVNEAGEITVNGKPVNKILVNGKPFFGDDPTIATRNLTKDIVEKIQVTDTKTEEEAFSGEDGDQENKTINLTISEDKNKGIFGRFSAGGGTDNRFEYAGIVNAFDGDRRISAIGGGNNINITGFSFGGGQNDFGGSQGVINSRDAGVDYTETYSESVNASLSYFYSGTNTFNETTTARENILPESRFFSNSISRSDSDNDNHSVNTFINIKRDSTVLISIRPSFDFIDNRSRSDQSEESLDEDSNLINQSNATNLTTNQGRDFSNTISVSKKWGSRGAYVRAILRNNINRQESEDFINSNTQIFGDDASTIDRDQFTDGDTEVDQYNLNLLYRMPLISKKLFLDVGLEHRNDIRNTNLSTFDFDQSTQEYSLFNSALSSDFKAENQNTTPKLNVNYSTEKYSFNFSSGYVFRTLENKDRLRPELDIKQKFEAFELSSYIRYTFSSKKSLYVGVNKSNAAPDVSQLNPFVDVSDPLNVVMGNPDLSPSNIYSFYGGFNTNNFQKGRSYYIRANGSITNDAVISKTTIDDNLVSTTTYENVDGNYRLGIRSGYNKKTKLDSLRTLNYDFSLSTNITRSLNFNNDVRYASLTSSFVPRLSVRYTWKDFFEIRGRYDLSFSKTTFGIDLFNDQEFLTHNAGFDAALFAFKNWEWRNDINYSFNPNIESDFQRSAWFWNTTVTYSFAKNNATAKLKIYDVLNQNTNARRTTNANFIQDVQSTVLEQYVVLGLSWKFTTLGKKGKKNADPFSFL